MKKVVNRLDIDITIDSEAEARWDANDLILASRLICFSIYLKQ